MFQSVFLYLNMLFDIYLAFTALSVVLATMSKPDQYLIDSKW